MNKRFQHQMQSIQYFSIAPPALKIFYIFSCSNITIYRGTTRKSSTGVSANVQVSVIGGSRGLKGLHTAENKKTPWNFFLFALGWKRADSGSTSDWSRIKFYFSVRYSWKNVIFLIELSLLSRLFSSQFFSRADDACLFGIKNKRRRISYKKSDKIDNSNYRKSI